MRYNYPRPQSLVPSVFAERPALRVLHDKASVLVQQFCDGCHWHNLVLFGPEQRAYYWEPMGSSLGGRHAIKAAFERAAPSGWELESIPVGSRCKPTAIPVAIGRTTSAAEHLRMWPRGSAARTRFPPFCRRTCPI